MWQLDWKAGGGIGVVALLRRESGRSLQAVLGVVKGLAQLAWRSVGREFMDVRPGCCGSPCCSGRDFSGALTWPAGGCD